MGAGGVSNAGGGGGGGIRAFCQPAAVNRSIRPDYGRRVPYSVRFDRRMAEPDIRVTGVSVGKDAVSIFNGDDAA
jgi:hypothetical protein